MTPSNKQCQVVAPALRAPECTTRRKPRRTLFAGLQKAAILGAVAVLPIPVVAGTANAQAVQVISQIHSVSQEVVLVNSYQDISNLHYRFIELLDARDNAGMAALFANGTFELNFRNTFTATGEEAVFALLQRLFPTKPTAEAWSRHYVTNLIIETDDELGTATDRLYSSAWGVRAGKPAHFVGMGRHVGDFELINGEWVFKKLVIYADVDYPYPVDQPEEPPQISFEEALNAFVQAVAAKVSTFVSAVSDVFNAVVSTAVRIVKAVLNAVFNPGQQPQTATALATVADDSQSSADASAADATETEGEDAAESIEDGAAADSADVPENAEQVGEVTDTIEEAAIVEESDAAAVSAGQSEAESADAPDISIDAESTDDDSASDAGAEAEDQAADTGDADDTDSADTKSTDAGTDDNGSDDSTNAE
ncbi:nuclear transport factor 2 family protein [Mycobacterium sp. 236(2023)]|uniref:nuclear transport factor 2 family protein n=1 Tax=Mycobacterium sp. 236(2023) TaxID=3038163 RepID=UPI0024154856|nr:nuclear transport factor 2 family protein [Mycobacterium sp. 236(2023)]MDG4668104.1 nuclear transport factor 2 family protein [Mycobacterium sp. 236(2023)]